MTRFFLTLGVAGLLATAVSAAPGDHFMENWDLDANGTVTVAEIETHRADVFYMFDTDENGVLDAEEFAAVDAVRANELANQPRQGRGALRQATEGMTLAFNDTDGDGSVSEAEFIAQGSAWFAMVDRDGNGEITSADFGRN